MAAPHIFISHASADDAFVNELRSALESHGLSVWVDSRNLRGGNKLAPEIAQAIKDARQVLVVLSPNTINSLWVREEIRQALEHEARARSGAERAAKARDGTRTGPFSRALARLRGSFSGAPPVEQARVDDAYRV